MLSNFPYQINEALLAFFKSRSSLSVVLGRITQSIEIHLPSGQNLSIRFLFGIEFQVDVIERLYVAFGEPSGTSRHQLSKERELASSLFPSPLAVALCPQRKDRSENHRCDNEPSFKAYSEPHHLLGDLGCNRWCLLNLHLGILAISRLESEQDFTKDCQAATAQRRLTLSSRMADEMKRDMDLCRKILLRCLLEGEAQRKPNRVAAKKSLAA